MFGHLFLDFVNGCTLVIRTQHIFQNVLRHVQRDFLVAQQLRMGNHAAQGAFQFADVGSNFAGQKFGNFLRQLDSQLTRLVFQNADAQVEIGRMNVCDQTAAEP